MIHARPYAEHFPPKDVSNACTCLGSKAQEILLLCFSERDRIVSSSCHDLFQNWRFEMWREHSTCSSCARIDAFTSLLTHDHFSCRQYRSEMISLPRTSGAHEYKFAPRVTKNEFSCRQYGSRRTFPTHVNRRILPNGMWSGFIDPCIVERSRSIAD